MAEKKETKQRPLKKGDFVRIAMEVMMKQHEPKTKEELQELKALEKEVEGLETQLTALVGGYIIQSLQMI
jgi:peroxiredoxin family protein